MSEETTAPESEEVAPAAPEPEPVKKNPTRRQLGWRHQKPSHREQDRATIMDLLHDAKHTDNMEQRATILQEAQLLATLQQNEMLELIVSRFKC